MGEQLCFEEWDAVETPGGVGDFVNQLSFGDGGGSVLIDELLDVAILGFRVLSGQDGGLGSGRHSFTPLLYLCSRNVPSGSVGLGRPCRNALRDERCLPDSVRGPVEWRGLARLVAARSSFKEGCACHFCIELVRIELGARASAG